MSSAHKLANIIKVHLRCVRYVPTNGSPWQLKLHQTQRSGILELKEHSKISSGTQHSSHNQTFNQ